MGSRAYRSMFKGVDPHDLLTWLLLPQWSNKNGEDWVDFWDSAENTGSSKFIYPQALFVPSPFYLQRGVGGGGALLGLGRGWQRRDGQKPGRKAKPGGAEPQVPGNSFSQQVMETGTFLGRKWHYQVC